MFYRLHNLVAVRQQEKQSLAALERKLQDERRLRNSLEQQLAAEKKKKTEDAVTKSVAV
jgi:Macoilin family